jgi:hypothetical protein
MLVFSLRFPVAFFSCELLTTTTKPFKWFRRDCPIIPSGSASTKAKAEGKRGSSRVTEISNLQLRRLAAESPDLLAKSRASGGQSPGKRALSQLMGRPSSQRINSCMWWKRFGNVHWTACPPSLQSHTPGILLVRAPHVPQMLVEILG